MDDLHFLSSQLQLLDLHLIVRDHPNHLHNIFALRQMAQILQIDLHLHQGHKLQVLLANYLKLIRHVLNQLPQLNYHFYQKLILCDLPYLLFFLRSLLFFGLSFGLFFISHHFSLFFFFSGFIFSHLRVMHCFSLSFFFCSLLFFFG